MNFRIVFNLRGHILHLPSYITSTLSKKGTVSVISSKTSFKDDNTIHNVTLETFGLIKISMFLFL